MRPPRRTPSAPSPMKLLIVAATPFELAPLVATLTCVADTGKRLTRYRSSDHDIDLLTTGVGMVATAAWTARALAMSAYGAALNLGVCGSFDAALPNGTVVHVTTDRIGELGAEDGERFLTLHELGLLDEHDFPFTGGRLTNRSWPASAALQRLPVVEGLTVNTVHGDERSIADVVARFHPQVESMEGAAFLYCCLTAGVPCAQVRAVSNRIERRNRPAWNVPLAVKTLNEAAAEILADW